MTIKILLDRIPDNPPPGARYAKGQVHNVTGFFQFTHEGLVLRLGEHNYSDDSDFYAEVWDDDASRPAEIGYATTRGWTYGNSATVDATPEVRGKYDAYKARLAAEYRAACEALEAAVPHRGRTVRVVKGRKVPVGTVAEVAWYDPDGKWGARVGLDIDGGRVFLSASNVEVIAAET